MLLEPRFSTRDDPAPHGTSGKPTETLLVVTTVGKEGVLMAPSGQSQGCCTP